MQLKPCPFCGEMPQWYAYPTLSGVECKKCGFSISSYGACCDDNRDGQWWIDVIADKWNKRAPNTDQLSRALNVIETTT